MKQRDRFQQHGQRFFSIVSSLMPIHFSADMNKANKRWAGKITSINFIDIIFVFNPRALDQRFWRYRIQ